MTRDLRTLLVIVVGAAVAGWLIVRLVTPGTPAPGERVAAVPRLTPVPDAADADAPTPPAMDRGEDAGAVGDGEAEADPEAVLHDLDVLVRAVRTDKFVQNRAFPENTQILELPSVIHYLRAVEFWQPAFSTDTGGDG